MRIVPSWSTPRLWGCWSRLRRGWRRGGSRCGWRRWRRKWGTGTPRSSRRSCICGSRWRDRANRCRSSWRCWDWSSCRSSRRWRGSNRNKESRTWGRDRWAGYSWCKGRYDLIKRLKRRAYNIIKKLQSYGFSSWWRKSRRERIFITRGRRVGRFMSSFSRAGWARWGMCRVGRETSYWR